MEAPVLVDGSPLFPGGHLGTWGVFEMCLESQNAAKSLLQGLRLLVPVPCLVDLCIKPVSTFFFG